MPFYSSLGEGEQKLLDYVEQTLNEQAASLQALVRIPSVKAEPEGRMPFGRQMQLALDEALALGKRLGFKTRDLDGYAGVIDYGEGEEMLGILAHLDIVPAGDGWTMEPFGGQLSDGKIYGRGTLDNKGPAVSALYALAAIAASGIPLKRRVRIILGCDEESGWACMEHYKKHEKLPELSFSPDGMYPLVYSEKAVLQMQFSRALSHSQIRLSAGERSNVVPGTARAVLKAALVPNSFPEIEGFKTSLTYEGEYATLLVTGLGAHASTPQEGKNALLMLIQLLNTLPLEGEDALIIKTLAEAFKMDLHGESLGIDAEDESGRLTLNPGVISWDEEQVSLKLDSRLPHSITSEHVIKSVSHALKAAGFMLSGTSTHPAHLVPLESELVKKLLGVYRTQSGDYTSKPLAVGGGTYARAMGNSVAFGPEWPGEPQLAHMPDEYISLEDMKKNTLIMADAIASLAGEQS